MPVSSLQAVKGDWFVLVTNLAPCVGLRIHLWTEKGQQGDKGLLDQVIEVTMMMVQLPSGPTPPQVLISFFSDLSKVFQAPLLGYMLNMINVSLVQDSFSSFWSLSCWVNVMELQIEPGGQTEQASPTGVLRLGPKDLAEFRYLTVSVTTHQV